MLPSDYPCIHSRMNIRVILREALVCKSCFNTSGRSLRQLTIGYAPSWTFLERTNVFPRYKFSSLFESCLPADKATTSTAAAAVFAEIESENRRRYSWCRMRSISGILLAAFLLASYEGQMASAQDWLNDLLSGVNAQVAQINRDVHQQVSRINQDVQDQVAKVNQDVQVQVARAQEAAKNAKPGDFSSSVNQGNTVIINGNRGYYRTVNSGVDNEGRPYSIEIEDRVKDGVLRHTERIYNSTTKRYQTYVSERKLSDPQAEPIFNNFTTTSQS